jgi:hypothetical protein
VCKTSHGLLDRSLLLPYALAGPGLSEERCVIPPIMFTLMGVNTIRKGAFKGGIECINGDRVGLKFRFFVKRGLGLGGVIGEQ